MSTVNDELKRKANDGDTQAQYELALKYYKGNGEQYDPRTGYLWMKVAAENKDIRAQKALALLYSSAQYAPYPNENPQEAFRMYQMAAEQEDAQAQYWLGRCYLVGYGTEASEEQGKKWIHSAIARGYVVGKGEELYGTEAEASQKEKDSPNGASSDKWQFFSKNKGKDAENEPEDDAEKDRNPLPGPKTEQGGDSEPKDPKAQKAAANHIREKFSDVKYIPLKMALRLSGLFALLAAVLGVLINMIILAVRGRPDTKGLLLLLIMIILGAIIGFYYGYQAARQRARDLLYYHNTPFYAQCKTDYENLDPAGKHAYEVYARLTRIFTPYGAQSRPLGKTPFGRSRGYVFPYVRLINDEKERGIDLMVITEKGIYCVLTSGVTGKVAGAASQGEWQVISASGRVRYLANMLLQNEDRIRILRSNYRIFQNESIPEEIPIYSIVCFRRQVEWEGFDDIPTQRKWTVMNGGGEKVRSFIEMQESRGTLYTKEMEKVLRMLADYVREGA